MATPAPQSTHHSYTAGSCRLDVTSQISALSQWSGRPIVQALTFKLWLSETLVAEGDRANLQLIADYVQSKTHSLLTVAALGASDRPAAASPPPEILKLPQPISYLHICDLTAVLGQHEQAAQTLPVALPVVQAIASTAVASTTLSAVAAAPSATQSTADNVVSIGATRRRPARINPARRQQNHMVWASSAAAALFAVGLTSTLWSRSPELQSTRIKSAGESAASINPNKPERELNQSADQPANTADATELETTEQQPGSFTDLSPDISTNSERSAPGTIPRNPTPTARPISPSALPTQPSAPAQASPTPITIPEQATESSRSSGATSVPTTRPVAPTQNAEPGASPNTNTEALEPSQNVVISADSDAPESLQRRRAQAATDSSALPSAASQADESIAAEGPPEVTFSAPRSPAGLSRARPRLSAETFNDSGDAITSTINQVRAYFQTRWQANEAGPLTYQLQIAETGEVVSFAALNEASQNFRDRILPTDEPPRFPQPNSTIVDADETPQNLTLRIILTRDGQVQISEF